MRFINSKDEKAGLKTQPTPKSFELIAYNTIAAIQPNANNGML